MTGLIQRQGHLGNGDSLGSFSDPGRGKVVKALANDNKTDAVYVVEALFDDVKEELGREVVDGGVKRGAGFVRKVNFMVACRIDKLLAFLLISSIILLEAATYIYGDNLRRNFRRVRVLGAFLSPLLLLR